MEFRYSEMEYKKMKIDDVVSNKSILERKRNISSEELKNMSMEELIPLILLANIFGDVFLNKEIKISEQNVEKINVLYKSSGCICIDTSKMEYVEDSNDIFRIC